MLPQTLVFGDRVLDISGTGQCGAQVKTAWSGGAYEEAGIAVVGLKMLRVRCGVQSLMVYCRLMSMQSRVYSTGLVRSFVHFSSAAGPLIPCHMTLFVNRVFWVDTNAKGKAHVVQVLIRLTTTWRTSDDVLLIFPAPRRLPPRHGPKSTVAVTQITSGPRPPLLGVLFKA